jgi:hypothetical protein
MPSGKTFIHRVYVAILVCGLTSMGCSQDATPRTSVRIDTLAEKMSDAEVQALERLLPAGAEPWLLDAYGDSLGVEHVSFYLAPEATSRRLRRGKFVSLERRPGGWNWLWPARWKQESEGRYAQVAIEGREFDSIENEDDPNRPFPVYGDFTDAELISLLSAVRLEDSEEPIVGVDREWELDDGMVRVYVPSMLMGLRRQGAGWVVVKDAQFKFSRDP